MPTRKSAVIFIGIPGSGKSTFFLKYFGNQYVHINLDTLHTRNKEQALLFECIEAGRSFVVDNTNPTSADRRRYIVPAKAAGYSVTGFYFSCPISQCILRNEHREGKAKVPLKALKGIANRRELPCIEEGFDNLYVVLVENGGFTIKKWQVAVNAYQPDSGENRV